MRDFFRSYRERIENYIPMTVGNLAIFAFLIYLIVIVSQSVFANYRANQQIVQEQAALSVKRAEIAQMQDEINYDQTSEFKEMEAREKLGYMVAGESVVALPPDKPADTTPDSSLPESEISLPNYVLWWQYFFGKK